MMQRVHRSWLYCRWRREATRTLRCRWAWTLPQTSCLPLTTFTRRSPPSQRAGRCCLPCNRLVPCSAMVPVDSHRMYAVARNQTHWSQVSWLLNPADSEPAARPATSASAGCRHRPSLEVGRVLAGRRIPAAAPVHTFLNDFLWSTQMALTLQLGNKLLPVLRSP